MEVIAPNQNPPVVGHDAMTVAQSALTENSTEAYLNDDCEGGYLDFAQDPLEYDRAWAQIEAEFGDTHCYDWACEAWEYMGSICGYHEFRHRTLDEEGYLYRSYDASPDWPRKGRSYGESKKRVSDAESAQQHPSPEQVVVSQLRELAKLANALSDHSVGVGIHLMEAKEVPEWLKTFADHTNWAVGQMARELRQVAAGAAYLIENHPAASTKLAKAPIPAVGKQAKTRRWIVRTASTFGEEQESRRQQERERSRRG
ncbi:hypothetical protein EON82_16300 [bacterium]|nr:MAG: hypothetical protein EON82_16300 [bacterium]